jgi:hypothetical protein
MRLIRSRIIDFCAIMTGMFTAIALHGFSWGLDVGLCVAYTVEVLGLALTDKRAKVFPPDPSRPVWKILLMHLGFLVAVVVIARVCLTLIPAPPLPAPGQPRPIHWGLLLTVCAVFVLAYWEERLLFREDGSAAAKRTADDTGFEPLVPSSAIEPLVPPPASMPTVNGVALESFASVTAPVEEPVLEAPAAAVLASSSAADEHDAFMQYLNGKNRAFRKPGASVKQEYEMWLAHRAKIQSGAGPKKSGLGRFF